MYQGKEHTSRDNDLIKYTSCNFHCMDKCILKVRVRDNRIVSVEPDDTINPCVAKDNERVSGNFVNTSMLQRRPCPRGYAFAREIDNPGRVKYPMKRVGKRGEGKFERISWDEALDTIANKMIEVKEKYGPFSIIHQPYSMFGMCSFPLASWFGAGIAGWGGISANGTHEPQGWVFGKDIFAGVFRSGFFEQTQDESNIFKSNLIVLWGMNPAATHGSGILVNLIKAKEMGIPVISIEPRYTPSVEVFADQWIPIRPTTDVAMMIAMANVWFKEGLCDNEFVEKWVEPHGLEKWKAYVLGVDDGVDKTPKWAESICAVPAETIEGFARLYAKSKPVNLDTSLTLGRQFYGENPTRAAMYLQALSGNVCIPGGTAAGETGLFWGTRSGPVPTVDWQQKPGSYQPPVLLTGYKWPKAIDLREDLDSGKISKERYNLMIGNLPDNPAPNIQMVILESPNMVNNLPDINKNIRAMNKVYFNLIFEQFTDSPSARYADILLPHIYTAFEGRNGGQGGMASLYEGGGLSPGDYFLYRQKCVDPPGEVKPNEWIWTQIAKRLGIAEMYNPRMAHVSDENWDEEIENLHREAYENWAARKEIVNFHPPSWEAFQKKPVFRYPAKGEPYYPFKREMDAKENPFKGTASGKIELHAGILAKGPSYLKKNDIPKGSGKCYGDGNLSSMARMSMGGRNTFYSKESTKYPLLMSSPHSSYRVHSWLDNNPWLKTDCYRHAIWMNVADAKSRAIRDNDLVRAFNDIGEIVLPAYVTSRIVPGTVILHHGAWYTPGEEKTALMPEGIDRRGAPNVLIHDVDLPETIVGYYPCKGLVQIEKWEDR